MFMLDEVRKNKEMSRKKFNSHFYCNDWLAVTIFFVFSIFSCCQFSWYLALAFDKVAFLLSTRSNNPRHLRWSYLWSHTSRVCLCLCFLSCFPKIIWTPAWKNGFQRASRPSFFLRYQSRRTNNEQIFSRCRLYGWSTSSEIPIFHSVFPVVLCRCFGASGCQFLGHFCGRSFFAHVCFHNKLLFGDLAGSKETGIDLPEPSVLTLLRNHGWLGNHSVAEDGKLFHQKLL